LQILQKPAAYYSRKFLVTKHAKGRQPVCKNAVENRKQRYTKNLACRENFLHMTVGLKATLVAFQPTADMLLLQLLAPAE
jgi:hypothetical protein